ncbi:MAG: DUF2161 domain-containing phosphodiesterase [Pseudomonadota bacterium]
MAAPALKETDLYAPIKQFLEGQGYEVKSEVGATDVVARRGEEDPVIVELKARFSLSLFHQAVERQAITDAVYVAVPRITGKAFQKAVRNNRALCRRLGLGLLTVRMKDGVVDAILDPAPYTPRQSKRKQTRLLREFTRLVGDPNTGGSTRRGLMTAYRQDALRCLNVLSANGPTKAALVAKAADVTNARRLMADNHYGWFERVEKGIYALSPKGESATQEYRAELETMLGAMKKGGS